MGSRLRSTSVLIAVNLLGTVLAFGREMAIAYRFGAGVVTDAYFVALIFLSTLQLLLGAGTLNPVFIPVFMDYVVRGDEQAAWNVTNTVVNLLLIILSLLVTVQIVAAPWLVTVLAPGFDVETSRVAARLVRVMALSTFFLVLAGIAGGVLNSHKHFLLPSLTLPLANAILILAVFTLATRWGIMGLAVGVVIAAASQLFVQIPIVFRLGYRYARVMALRLPGVVSIAKLSGPMLASVAVLQISPIGERLLASMTGEGNVSVLNYGFKIAQMPFHVFAMAVATVTLPFLTERASSSGDKPTGDYIASGILPLLFVILPSVVFLFSVRVPLIRLLLERGAFTLDASNTTASVLGWYVLGLLPYAMNSLLLQIFYAAKNTVVPFLINLVFVVISLGIARGFIPLLALNAIPMGWSIGMGVVMTILIFLIEAKVTHVFRQRVIIQICKLMIASVIMLIMCRLVVPGILNDGQQDFDFVQSFLGLMVTGVVSCVTYFFSAWLLRVDPAVMLCRSIRTAWAEIWSRLSL